MKRQVEKRLTKLPTTFLALGYLGSRRRTCPDCNVIFATLPGPSYPPLERCCQDFTSADNKTDGEYVIALDMVYGGMPK